jgi:hypothetical protein
MYQFTAYALAYSSYLNKDKNFREKSQVSDDIAEELGGNPKYISDLITMEYFKLHYREFNDKGNITVERPQIFTTRRTDSHYQELCKLYDQKVQEIHEMIAENTFIPNRGNHCLYCQYLKPCDEMGYDTHPEMEENGQLFLLKPYVEKPVRKTRVQKTFRFPKK